MQAEAVINALVQYGLPSTLLAAVSYAFYGFIKQRDEDFSKQAKNFSDQIKAKDKEIARLNEERVKEHKECMEKLRQISDNALQMTHALSSLSELEQPVE